MKYVIFTFLGIFLLSCGQSQESRKKFYDEAGDFKINFPSSPMQTTATISDKYGKQTVYSFLSEPQNDNNVFYEVRYIDFPDEVLADFDKELVYDLFLSLAKGTEDSSSLLAMGGFNKKILGYRGREYRWLDSSTNQFSRMVFYLVGRRLYQLTVGTSPEMNHNKNIDSFFDSFELVDTEPNSDVEIGPINFDPKVFSIDFPYPTEKKEMVTLTEYGNVKIFVEGSQHSPDDEQNLGYMVSVMKYPKDITKTENFDLDKHYSELIENGLQNRQTELISRKEVVLNGISGIETKENFGNGQMTITQRSFLKGDTQIIVNVMTIPSKDDNIEMKKFLASLELE